MGAGDGCELYCDLDAMLELARQLERIGAALDDVGEPVDVFDPQIGSRRIEEAVDRFVSGWRDGRREITEAVETSAANVRRAAEAYLLVDRSSSRPPGVTHRRARGFRGVPRNDLSPGRFTLLLPRDWVTLDLNPDTAEESVRRAVDGMVRVDPACAERRVVVEELLLTMAREAIADGKLLCGVRFSVDDQGRPLQALVSVALRSVGPPTDPYSLFERMDDGSTDGRVVTREEGPALRVQGRSEGGFMTWGLFIPVPGTDDVVVELSLLSPSVDQEEPLAVFFDGLGDSFRFNGDEDPDAG